MTAECRCGRPARDHAYICDTCADQLARSLGDVPWLTEQMDVTITRQQGIDYRRVGGGKGGKKPAERPLPGNWTASEAMTHLKALLVSWVLFCDAEAIRSSDPDNGLPVDTPVATSRWLMWRVDGLMLHDIAPEAVDEITSAVAHCHRLIDRHPDRQYLGACGSCPDGRLYSTRNGKWATCNACDASTEAEAIRARLLTELDDRLCTAAEIARLSTYLGLDQGRDKVRNRINQWHKRGVISSESMFDEPAFRFGTVYDMLVRSEYATNKAG